MPLANPPFDLSWDLQSFSIQDNIYVVGKENWEYDTRNDEWIQQTSHPDGRRFAATFSINGKGYMGTGISIKTSRFQNDFWEFSPE